MRAEVVDLAAESAVRNVEIVCNQLEPEYVERVPATKKYRKVGKETRSKLLRFIQSGWSIVNVAKKLAINYSTAKSIAQSYRRNGKPELIET